MKEFWKKVFSEGGEPSSKRVAGVFMLVVACVCIIITVARSGCTECVKDLLQTIIISGMSLLGLSSVTSIFKGGKAPENNTEK